MKRYFLFSAFIFCISAINGQIPQNSYHVINKVVVNNSDNQLTKLAFILPLAQSNPYQTVTHVNYHNGEKLDIPGSDDCYIRWIFTDHLPGMNQSKETYYEFDVTLNAVNIDFSKITTIYPYSKTSDIFRWYTGASGEYVDPKNHLISRVGDSIWSQSIDVLDYARRSYEWVASHYQYLNPYTGLHTLQDILNAGGGDCGNLTSIYVSLLRNKEIPARHIVTVRPDGVYHVWADFYLEKYGWVPVDVTYKNSNPKGDFFGKYDGSGIVMTKNVWLPVDKGNGETYYADILQSYTLWMWTNNIGGSRLTSSHNVLSTQYQMSSAD
jgi:hypothetical protein